jgi:hypothetical protein
MPWFFVNQKPGRDALFHVEIPPVLEQIRTNLRESAAVSCRRPWRRFQHDVNSTTNRKR